jgi:hypothetical protein
MRAVAVFAGSAAGKHDGATDAKPRIRVVANTDPLVELRWHDFDHLLRRMRARRIGVSISSMRICRDTEVVSGPWQEWL